jgi:hypothetical protein
MIQEISLTPSTAPLGFSPWFAGAPIGVRGEVPSDLVMTSWQMQLRKFYHDSDAPIMTANGVVVGNVATIVFTAAQTAELELSYEAGANPHYLMIGGTDSAGQKRIVRAGSIEITPGSFDVDAVSSIGVPFTVTDDVISFEIEGVTYTFQGVPGTPPLGATEASVTQVDDVLIFTLGGTSWAVQAVEQDE